MFGRSGGSFAKGALDLEAGDDEGEWVCQDVGDGGAGGAGYCVTEGWQCRTSEYVFGFMSFLNLMIEIEGILLLVS